MFEFWCIGANSIALGSISNLSKFKNLELDKSKIYITAFDNDETGEKATEELIDFLNETILSILLITIKDENCRIVIL